MTEKERDKMKKIEKEVFENERALYGEKDIDLIECRFAGEADGESALKECKNISVARCAFDLRYPLWHDTGVRISDSSMSETCRAALWYTEEVQIIRSRLHGTKALRECTSVKISECDIRSAEFGWMCDGIECADSSAEGEYFMFRARNLTFNSLNFRGKYSFQYIENATFDNCILDTKDAFWHAKNVQVRNSVVKGEYLGWYCENVTFENCRIIGTQPLCYCKGLKLINCECEGCDLSFEKSEVEATVIGRVDSIKNPKCGNIYVGGVGELIFDDVNAHGRVIIEESL